jgi:plasmid stability protein
MFDIIDIKCEAYVADLLIRGIPDHLKNHIAKRAGDTGRSLSDEAKELLRKGFVAESNKPLPAGETAYDALRRSLSGVRLTGEDHAELMQAIEEGRKDMGRPAHDSV